MYKKIKISKTETRDEHRLIMERRLGRKLSFNEVVHHVDEIKTNNEEYNLKIMSRSEHTSLHMTGRKIETRTLEKLIDAGRKNRTNARLNEEQVITIKKLFNDHDDLSISKIFNVSKRTICDIRNGKTWNWL